MADALPPPFPPAAPPPAAPAPAPIRSAAPVDAARAAEPLSAPAAARADRLADAAGAGPAPAGPEPADAPAAGPPAAPGARPPIDLRARLLGWLALWVGVWLSIALLLTGLTLQRGIAEESVGAHALTELLIVAGEAQADPVPARLARLQALIDTGQLRHLRAQWAPGSLPPPSADLPPAEVAGPLRPAPAAAGAGAETPLVERVAAWFGAPSGGRAAAGPSHRIEIGPHVLLLSPDPHSEVAEILADSLPLLGAWLAVGLLMMASVGGVVARALGPARALCAGLARLEDGADSPGFGPHAFRLREFAAIAGGIERMAHRLAQARHAQQRLSRRLIGLQEDERRALARDLHDELGQHLSAMAAQAALLQRHADKLAPARLQETARVLQDELQCVGRQLRQLLAQLRPHGLNADGLADELSVLVAQWRLRCPEVSLSLDRPPVLPPLDEAVVLVLYRAVQEGLSNAFRHSGAREIRLRLDAREPGWLSLHIVDDGCGLPPDGAAAEGSGLLSMRERAAMVGGRLSLAPAGGPPRHPGLALCLRLPCAAALPGLDPLHPPGELDAPDRPPGAAPAASAAPVEAVSPLRSLVGPDAPRPAAPHPAAAVRPRSAGDPP